MLAEKFLLVLETLIKSQIQSTTYSDGRPPEAVGVLRAAKG